MKKSLIGTINGAPVGAYVFPYHFSESERAQISGMPRWQQFEAPGGVEEGWTTIQLGDPSIAWSEPFYHDGTERTWALEGNKLRHINPTPLRRDGGLLLNKDGIAITLRGIGNYPWLCDRRKDPQRLVQIAAEGGCNLVRTFRALNRCGDKSNYVSPFTSQTEHDQRLTKMLETCESLGVFLLYTLGDEPGRNSKKELGSNALPTSEDPLGPYWDGSFLGIDRFMNNALSRIPSSLQPYCIPEVNNEPSNSWMDRFLEEYMADIARSMYFTVIANNVHNGINSLQDFRSYHLKPGNDVPYADAPICISSDGAGDISATDLLKLAGNNNAELYIGSLTDPPSENQRKQIATIGGSRASYSGD